MTGLAQAAVALGLPCFPCNAHKKPVTTNGFRDASRDPAAIRRMFAARGAALIGVPTGAASSTIVVDVDTRDGGAGLKWLAANERRLPPTRRHATPSGGFHLLFAYPADADVRCSVGAVTADGEVRGIAPGVDVRGAGGYVIVPPSLGYLIVNATPPAAMPEWLVAACQPRPTATPEPEPPAAAAEAHLDIDTGGGAYGAANIDTGGTAYGAAALDAECARIAAAPFGTQETTMTEAALKVGGLVAGGELDEGPALHALLAAARGIPSQPGKTWWAMAEIDRKMRSAFARGQRKPRQAPPRPNGQHHTKADHQQQQQQQHEPHEPPPHEPPQPEQDPWPEPPPQDDAATEPPAAEARGNINAAIDALVDRFNGSFMVVNEAGRATILQPGFDPVLRRRRFDRLTIRDLQALYMNETLAVGLDDKGREVRKAVAEIWLRHHRRKQFIHGVTFDPTAKQATPCVLNLWEGFAVKPAPGDWSLMRAHMEKIICDGDPERLDYLLGWLARMFQRPAEQGEVAVVMKGGEGTGKGTLAKAVMQLVGHHGLAISNGRHLVGNFNAHLRDVIFLFADEAFFAGDRAHVGALKSLITEPYLTVEAKFANAIQAPNFLHVLMASNEEWVVPAAQDARRFFVLEVSEAEKGNHGYFAAIWDQLNAGGLQAMLHDLLTMDLRAFNVRAIPTTEGLQRQRKLSLPTTEAWWLDCLERGYVYRSRLGLENDLAAWYPTISTELLFASYIEFAKSHSERRTLSRETLGRFFVNLGAAASRWRNGVVGEHVAETENAYGGVVRRAALVKAPRTCGYKVGSLEQARAGFTKATGLQVVWDSGCTDEDDPTS